MILSSVSPLGVERVELLAALGRVVAEDVVAPWDLPSCDNSAMDGFAVRSADCRRPGSCRSPAISRPEEPSVAVEPGCAVRIMTGAPIPPAATPWSRSRIPKNGRRRRPAGEGRASPACPLPGGGRAERRHGHFRRHDHPAAGDQHAGFLRQADRAGLSQGAGRGPLHRRRADRAGRATGERQDHQQQRVVTGRGHPGGGAEPSSSASHATTGKPSGADAEGLKADALITSAGVSAGDRDLVRDCLAELGVVSCSGKWISNRAGPPPSR